jgi:hypothetical protein
MTSVSASLRLRPTRIGFLVDPADADSLRRVFQVCTCLWGGAYNPIIPVCSSIPDCWRDDPFLDPSPTELANGYINFFEPDVFVEAREGLADAIGLPRTDCREEGGSLPSAKNWMKVIKEGFRLPLYFARKASSVTLRDGANQHSLYSTLRANLI